MKELITKVRILNSLSLKLFFLLGPSDKLNKSGYDYDSKRRNIRPMSSNVVPMSPQKSTNNINHNGMKSNQNQNQQSKGSYFNKTSDKGSSSFGSLNPRMTVNKDQKMTNRNLMNQKQNIGSLINMNNSGELSTVVGVT